MAIYYALGREDGTPIAALGEFRNWGDARDAGVEAMRKGLEGYSRLAILKVTTALHGYAERNR